MNHSDSNDDAWVLESLCNVRWDKLESAAVLRIRALSGAVRCLAEGNEEREYRERIALELILPALKRLVEFCDCVVISPDGGELEKY